MNSLLQCPLPIETLLEISELLGINASTKDVSTSEPEIAGSNNSDQNGLNATATQSAGPLSSGNPEGECLTVERPQKIFSLLAACSTELLRADTAERIMPPQGHPRILVPKEIVPPPSINTQLYEPLLPPSVSDQMQVAMHEALVNVMAERDEAHAQLIASNIFHVHELEQERRRNEKLRIEQELKEERAKFQQPNVGAFFQNLHDDRARRNLLAKFDDFERILGNNTDEELAQTSRQLAEEVSAKTSHALEIVRLKEARDIERQNEAAEKQALKDELLRVKALLAEQEAKMAELENAARSKT